MESSECDLRGSDAPGSINLITQGHSALVLRTVGVGALALALPELGAEPVIGRIPKLKDLTSARHHHPKLTLEVDMVLLFQRLDEAHP